MAKMKEQEEDEEGMLFDVHDRLRELVTQEYEKVEGRCEICLEELATDEGSNPSHLVSLDGCFHRFHLLCIHRYWFMERQNEEDSYGIEIKYDLPTEHQCALCRTTVEPEQVSQVKKAMAEQPFLEDGGYT